jgi:hypothetical protein
MRDLYAKCGNNCGRCALYQENLTDDKRQWCAEGMARYIGWNPKPENLRLCAGCQSTGGFHYIKNCAVRMCAMHNGIENCAYCAAFPCRDVPTVSVSVDYRDRVSERLGAPIPEEDYLAFIEPYEGMVHLEAIRASLAPESLVEVRPVAPLRTRMAAFPDDLPLSEDDLSAYRSLYGLLTKVLTAPADLYVRQMRLKARRKEILSLLWAFGRYGEFDEGGSSLLVDGPVHEAQKPFSNIVRKRDNAFHSSAAESAQILRDLGVSVEHIPFGKNEWQLKMSFDHGAGGVPAMGALKRYVTTLVAQHGEPEYAGSSRYKGETYVRFSRADMQVLGGA